MAAEFNSFLFEVGGVQLAKRAQRDVVGEAFELGVALGAPVAHVGEDVVKLVVVAWPPRVCMRNELGSFALRRPRVDLLGEGGDVCEGSVEVAGNNQVVELILLVQYAAGVGKLLVAVHFVARLTVESNDGDVLVRAA